MAINNRPEQGYDQAENARQGDVAIRVGKIKECRFDVKEPPPDPEKEKPNWTNVDLQGNYRGSLYRVEFGDGETYWMPKMALRAGEDQDYWAFEKDEQVLVVCVGGDPMQSYIIGATYQDDYRPPIGIDDKTSDKRPWRETVRRIRFKDGMVEEYDRELHRKTTLYPDGTKHTRWFKDERVEREKAADSDITGVPPRHFEKWEWPSGYSREYMWDEHAGHHYKKEIWPDGTTLEFHYDENGNVHKHSFQYADGGLFQYDLISHTLTIKADRFVVAPATGGQTDMTISGTIIDSAGNTPHHSH